MITHTTGAAGAIICPKCRRSHAPQAGRSGTMQCAGCASDLVWTATPIGARSWFEVGADTSTRFDDPDYMPRWDDAWPREVRT